MNDLTRWNRKDRRDVRAHAHITIPGRNLPYQKNLHGSLKDFNELREREIVLEYGDGPEAVEKGFEHIAEKM